MKQLTKSQPKSEMNERENNNLAVCYEAASESIVLLKNENKVLPLKNKKVALFGSGVIKTIKGGTGSGDVNERHSVNIYEGFLSSGFEITTKKINEKYKELCDDKEKEFIKKQKKKLYLHPFKIATNIFESFKIPEFFLLKDEDLTDKTDTCIYVISRQSGEGKDNELKKGEIFLTDIELENIKKCSKHYEKIILIINSTMYIDLSFTDSLKIDAILYASPLGIMGGNAIADIIIGKKTPSAKLSDTWVKKYEVDNKKEKNNIEYNEGIFVGYRYYDSFNIEPRYEFGYGLSYTDFLIDNIKTNVKDNIVNISFDIKNIGLYNGKEIIELYITKPKTKIDKEYQNLISFEKTKVLKPNETENITLTFNIDMLKTYDEDNSNYIIEKGDYIIRLGTSSKKTKPILVLSIENDTILSKHKRICKSNIKEIISPKRNNEDLKDINKIKIDLSNIKTDNIQYNKLKKINTKNVNKILDTLTVKDMINLCVGIGSFSKKVYFNLPGSVGNSTSTLIKKGLINLTFCDGPSGLRVSKESILNKNGKIEPIENAFEGLKIMTPNIIKKIKNTKKNKSTILYQYTTAFPTPFALAHSWNKNLLENVGKCICSEMLEYGCTNILAPAVNIHRTPLCGRNYEYFSEDPFLTGFLATHYTLGFKNNNVYTTIKHFACNNQEFNRFKSSSNLNERTLREIYLKPFEIVIKNGYVNGVMTSYNKINGIYPSNSEELCLNVLRNEWDFNGIVMTDWYQTLLSNAKEYKFIKIGNNLIMPGGIYFRLKLYINYLTKKITKEDLKKSCSYTINMILNSSLEKEYITKNSDK